MMMLLLLVLVVHMLDSVLGRTVRVGRRGGGVVGRVIWGALRRAALRSNGGAALRGSVLWVGAIGRVLLGLFLWGGWARSRDRSTAVIGRRSRWGRSSAGGLLVLWGTRMGTLAVGLVLPFPGWLALG